MKRFVTMLASMLVLVMTTGLTPAHAKVTGKDVEYTAGGVALKGYLAYDTAKKGKGPGVLVVHEWWGLNDYARERARMLARLGYTALAVDMYGEGKTATHPDDAGKFSSELMQNFDTAKARFLAAEDFLKMQPTVDPGRIAAIGYCFGGGVVLNMARQGADLKAVASFHGNLTAIKPAEPGMVTAKIRVYHGADDKFVIPEAVEAFKKEMTDAKADFRFIAYPGAVHSFTNPEATAYGKKFNLPLAYDKKADRESWADMKKFFAETLKK
ncbi:MAG TPA: dienelactone hydrolase family protein [Nitrospirota bacterium]|nr:dienelactone hydrolase family protein [Nitrospirota bacterium]